MKLCDEFVMLLLSTYDFSKIGSLVFIVYVTLGMRPYVQYVVGALQKMHQMMTMLMRRRRLNLNTGRHIDSSPPPTLPKK